jgi:hypothetical protein
MDMVGHERHLSAEVHFSGRRSKCGLTDHTQKVKYWEEQNFGNVEQTN